MIGALKPPPQFDDGILDILFKIKDEHSDDIFKNVRRVKALLADYKPGAKKEIVQIINLLEINAYFKLKAQEKNRDFLVLSLFRQLIEEYNVNEAAALWGLSAIIKLAGGDTAVKMPAAAAPKAPAPLNQKAPAEYKNEPPGPKAKGGRKLLLAPGRDFIAYVKDGKPGVYNNEYLDNALKEAAKSWRFGEINGISAGLRHVAVVTAQGLAFIQGESGPKGIFEGVTEAVCGNFYTLGLSKDGSILFDGDEMPTGLDQWQGIRHMSSSGFTAAGLLRDSRLILAGEGGWGHYEAQNWENIYKFSVGEFNISAVKKNGAGLCAGDNSCNQTGMEKFTDLDNICQGDFHTVGLRTNRTLAGTGDNSFGQLKFSHWKGIRQIFAGDRYTVGVNFRGEFFLAGESILWSGFCKTIL